MSTLVALPTMDQPRRHKKMLRDGSGEVWPDHAEVLFSKAIAEYDRQSQLASSHSPYPPDLPSRNEFIVRYLHDRGLERSKQQVASHIQQLKKRSSKELGIPSSPSSSVSSHSGGLPYLNGNSNISSIPRSMLHDAFYSSSQLSSYGGQPILPAPPAQPQLQQSQSSAQQSTNPITSIAIRVNDAQPLQVPTQPRPPNTYSTSGPATLTGVSGNGNGSMSIRIRLVVPPHQDALSHLASSRIFAIIALNPHFTVTTTTLGNKISVNNMFLLEETDNFVMQGNQLLCPLRMSAQTSMMVATQGPGLPVSIQQTVYGGSTSLLKITYELVHAQQPMHDSSALYQYPPTAGPFTQF